MYAVAKQGGWFSEAKGGYPDLALIGKNILAIRENPEAFFKDIPQSQRIPIYASIHDIRSY